MRFLTLLTAPNYAGGVVLVVLLGLAVSATGLVPSADTAARVESVLLELCKPAPRHRVNRNTEWREALAGHIADAAERHKEDPILLTVILYCESSFRPSAKGAMGERGMGQVHGVAGKQCDLGNIRGQVMCSAKWMASSRVVCDGSDSQAMTRYLTGGCKTKSRRALSNVRRRLRILGRLRISTLPIGTNSRKVGSDLLVHI